MLIRKNYQNKLESIYKCDKCSKEITNEELHRVVFEGKTYHLCKRHNIILKRWLLNIKKESE